MARGAAAPAWRSAPVWLLLAALTGLSYLVGDVDEVKGICQRGEQLVFGAWLALLGIWASRGNERLDLRPGSGGRIGGTKTF